MIEALDITVQGIVQGVGFRPFVYRMAKKYLITGWVLNAADGVHIHAQGEGKLLDEFVMELSDNAPAAAQVSQIELREVPLEDFDTFEIRFSDETEVEETTLVSPELATCDDCVRELFNANDRRYRYPFINCTNCGPRFTIVERLPYDRAATSMREFEMCNRCAAEYEDPGDRRFHAQPDACFECGPVISFAWWQTNEAAAAASCGTESCGVDENLCTEVCGASVSSTISSTAETFAAVTNDQKDLKMVWGKTREESDAIFARAVQVLLDGGIVAVKGLGGFHLVCDANNAEAVAKLRNRKRREGKAFAVMMTSAEDARAVCEVNEVEEMVLSGTQRPIVLLKKRHDAHFVPRLADGLSELGVMLPYTPVQHLLMHDFAQASCSTESCNPPMLVMTSGNVHDEPIVIHDEEAYAKLGEIADAFLGNNREILTRFDDSVVRVIKAGSAGFAVQFIRRARGYAPTPIPLALTGQAEQAAAAASCDTESCGANESLCTEVHGASASPAISSTTETLAVVTNGPKHKKTIFATGPEQKNTFTLLRGNEAFVSQHIGDMENAETNDAWLETKCRFEQLFETQPQEISCDMHPEYLTSKWAHDQNLPLTEVQHHHAHIVSVMAEQGLTDAVCGIAFDGTGYGVDGAIWGGEVMLVNLQTFERFANFAYVPMPGGAAAVKHPLRMAYGVLWAYDLLDHPGAQKTLEALGSQAEICDTMIERGINCPMTSSAGRLFDAASALLGVCVEPAYEGEAAILLEAALGSACLTASEPAAAAVSCGTESCGANESLCTEVHGASASPAIFSTTETLAVVTNDQECLAGYTPETERYQINVTKNTATETNTAQDTSVVLLDAENTFRALLDDVVAGVPTPVIARRFHDAFVGAIVTSAELVRALYGINTVVLSGGVFMNRYLIEHALSALEEAGFTAAINKDLPPNDGCISLGQAVVSLMTSK